MERITRPLTAEEKARHAQIREQVMPEFPPAQQKRQSLGTGIAAELRRARQARSLNVWKESFRRPSGQRLSFQDTLCSFFQNHGRVLMRRRGASDRELQVETDPGRFEVFDPQFAADRRHKSFSYRGRQA